VRDSVELEYAVLQAVAESSSPRGAVSIYQALKGRYKVSQATIGRILRDFDRRGLAVKQGYRGRVITSAGHQHLKSLFDSIVKSRQSAALLETLDGSDAEQLIKVLQARRALEREAARLAVANAGSEEVEKLRAIIAEQQKTLAEGRTATREGVLFHEALAAASGNEVLAHTLDLLRQEGQLSPLVSYIRNKKGGGLAADHVEILQCIERRDPEAAEKAVEDHINRLIDDVRRFFLDEGRAGKAE